jgi:antitoxin (DNA-binding transcriptional repressor) of toxin-antitoxin stability system
LLLGKHGKAVAKLVALTQVAKPRMPGALKGKIWVADDFDEPVTELWHKS